MKKITILEICVGVLLLALLALYLVPFVKVKKQDRQNSLVKANAAIFTSKSLSYFNENKKAKASEIAKKTTEELNTLSKNPYNKKAPAYVFEKQGAGSIFVESDDKIQTITITGFDNDNKILVRTLIKPPSFVTYEAERKETKND